MTAALARIEHPCSAEVIDLAHHRRKAAKPAATRPTPAVKVPTPARPAKAASAPKKAPAQPKKPVATFVRTHALDGGRFIVTSRWESTGVWLKLADFAWSPARPHPTPPALLDEHRSAMRATHAEVKHAAGVNCSTFSW